MKAIKAAKIDCASLTDIEQKRLCQGLSFLCGTLKNAGFDEDVCNSLAKASIETWGKLNCTAAPDNSKPCLSISKDFQEGLKSMNISEDAINKAFWVMRKWMETLYNK